MAKTTITVLTCDRCKAETGEDHDANESVGFGYEGYRYALDLCGPHAEDFHNTVQGMMSWSTERSPLRSRRARAVAVDGQQPEGPRRTSADREHLRAVREWARQNGYPDLSDRGRIPQRILDEFDAASTTR